MKRIVTLLSLLVVFGGVAAAAQAPGGADLQVRHIPGRGFRLAVGGVPVTRASSLQLHAPGWTAGYYSSSNGQPAVHSSSDNQWRVEHRAEKVGFDAAEAVRVEGNRVEWTLDARIRTKTEAHVEWTLGYVNAFAFYGGSYASDSSRRDKPVAIVPEPSRPGGQGHAITGAGEIRFESRLGLVVIKVEEGPAKLTLLDGRKLGDRWWANEAPSFWLGVLGAELSQDVPLKLRVSMTVTPRDKSGKNAAPLVASVPVVPVSDALSPQSRPVQIIPKPKSLTWGKGRFAITPTTVIVATPAAKAGADSVAREIKERFGWTIQVGDANAKPGPRDVIRFAPAGDQQIKPEGYVIECDEDALTITAADARGYFYAAQTLGQLLQVEKDSVFVPACRVDDWPSLAFRGVHIFTGKDSLPLHTKLIERIMARHKLNHVVLQADYTQWETDPAIWVDMSVPKEQVRRHVEVARRNLMEVTPLVMSLGHSEWMFKNGRNLDLAEDPDEPYAYSVTNPRTYEFITSVYDEALGIFGSPRLFHIGHDEVAMRGRYPHREEAKKLGMEKLFVRDTLRHHGYLKDTGIGMMMWGDVLLSREESNDGAASADSPGEARRMRQAIPKDVIICDWHYTPAKPEAYKSLKVFRDEGFKTIACTWYTPENIYTFAEAARLYGALGLLQTTWAGYSITQKAVDDVAEQFSAYVLAAEYAWSADSPRPADLPYRAEDVFTRAMTRGNEEVGVRPGTVVNLSGVSNSDPGNDWLGLGTAASVQRLYGDSPKDNVRFWSGDGAYPAVVLGGALVSNEKKEHPRQVTLRLDEPAVTARELAFLHTTVCRTDTGEVVGGYEVVYADGKTEKLPLRYGRETRAWDDTTSATAATIAWAGKTSTGAPATLRLLGWENPRPETTIREIRFTTDHPYASPVLLGVTAIR